MNRENFVSKIPTSELINFVFSSSKRSSIIPYFIIDDIRYYFMGIDSKYGGIIDMGGRMENNENYLTSSLRELYEESSRLFDYRDQKQYVIDNSITIYNNNNIYTFLQVQIENIEEADKLCKEFKKYRQKCIENKDPDTFLENLYIIYISEGSLKGLCNDEKIYLPKSLKKAIKPNKHVNMEYNIPSNFVKNEEKIKEYEKGLEYYPKLYEGIVGLLIGAFMGYPSLIEDEKM